MSSTTNSPTSPPAPSFNGITSSLQSALTNIYSTTSRNFNTYFPPKKRNAWKEWLTKFATEKPYLAAFLFSNIALSGPPLALFLIMTITVVISSVFTCLLVGLLVAVLFIVFAVGSALIFLIPTLFFTTAAAVFMWLWGIGGYFVVKWFNQKEVRVMNTGGVGEVTKSSGLEDLKGLNGETLIEEKGGRDGGDGVIKEGKTTGIQLHGHEYENETSTLPRKTLNKVNGEGLKEGAGASIENPDGAWKKVHV